MIKYFCVKTLNQDKEEAVLSGSVIEQAEDEPGVFIEDFHAVGDVGNSSSDDSITTQSLTYFPPRSTKKKVVMILYTLHDTSDKNNEVELSKIIDYHNKTNGGVNVFDAMSKKYSVLRKTKLCHMCIFMGN
ncbi:unnamed protein product [Parnassius apollo]|uniref:(apollo) hypothetical protein n=1 Tax=Parnassius apollo TaxID=110799 RepID=A0A8S3XFB3_PARAO|nr:unnamed protein product [Parnassius apollo]